MPRKPALSYKVKELICQLYMKHNQMDFAAIQRDLDAEMEKMRRNKGVGIGDTPDIRTIKKIVNEYKLRLDEESIKSTGQRSQINSDNIAMPIIIKAKEEHLTEIRNTIDKWLKTISIEMVDKLSQFSIELSPGEIDIEKSYAAIEMFKEEPLFESLKMHLPFTKLWNNYGKWEELLLLYVSNCEGLWFKLDKAEREAENWPDVVHVYPGSFKTPILRFIKSGQWIGKIPNIKDYKFHDDPEVDDVTGEEIGYYSLAIDGSGILVTDNVPSSSELYKNLINRLLNCEESVKVIQLWNELSHIESDIKTDLQEILLGRKYIMHTCSLCPGN